MDHSQFIALVSNIALLLALVYVNDIVAERPFVLNHRLRPWLIGLGLSIVVASIMLTPWIYVPGIIFDTRSVLIGICGLFFGFIPTLLVMTTAVALRIIQGGAATIMGVSVVITAGVIGLAWRHALKRPLTKLTWRDLLVFGYAVHIVMLACTFTLPWYTALDVIRHIFLPVLTIYPFSTAILGILMIHKLRREESAQKVRESEVQFRALSEQAAVGVTKTEAISGRYTFVNQRFADILGYTRDELLRMDFQSLTDPEDLAAEIDRRARLIRGESQDYSVQKRYRRKDGSFTWVNVTVSPLWKKNELPSQLIGIIQDISQQKQTEAALHASEEQLERQHKQMQAVFDSVPGTVNLYDEQGSLVLWNRQFEEMSGYSAEELSHMSVTDWFRGDGNNPGVIPAAHADGWSNSEALLLCKDGSTIPMYLAGASLEIGGQRYFAVIGLDITERKRTEKALQESENRYRMLFDNMTTGFALHEMLYDAQGTPVDYRFLAVNPAFERLTGLTADAIIGKTVLRVLPGTERFWIETYADVVRSGLPRLFAHYSAALGKWYEVQAFTLSPDNRFAVIFSDITDRKRAEEEKRSMEQQLLQSQKMEAIGQLAGGVAHDFNNMLTGILGNAALARSGLQPGDPVLENINAIEIAAHNAADLTHGLLTFGRNAPVHPVASSSTDLIGQAIDLLRPSLPATIEIVRDFQPDAWNILADRAQIAQILLNLAVNARDAMQGKGRITLAIRNTVIDTDYVRQHHDAAVGEYVHLSIQDTGAGIPGEIMEHLFEPFHTTKPAGSGTGLGLSIVYGAVKQSKGWITVTTAAGMGTTFNVYIPRCLLPVGQDEPDPVSAGVIDRCSTVLVVEDEPVVAGVAESFLRRSGCNVLLAADGNQAVQTFAAQKDSGAIELIMLDMTMPGMLVTDIVNALRKISPDVPILLNSGYASNDIVASLLDQGLVQGFLPKPYTPEQLVRTVNELLNRKVRD